MNENDDNKEEVEDFPPVFDNCLLLTFIVGYWRKWHKTINLKGKFPQLASLKLSLENIAIVPQIQQLLDSVSNTVSMVFIEFGFRAKDYKQSNEGAGDNDKPLFTLRMPPNLEILSIYCAEDMNFEIDLSACHNNLKMLIALQNSVKYIHNALEKNGKMSSLKYLVVNQLNDVYQLKWDLFKQCDVMEMYLPGVPSFAKTIQGAGDIKLYGYFPNVNDVRDNINNKNLRLLLRDLNNQQKRHYLWGYFWYEDRDKLKSEERDLIKQDSIEY